MAANRFDTWANDPGESQLKRYIRNACDPSNFEPNLALNLEISDLINQKKGTAPREAAVTIVNYINHRNPNVSLLALALLDICVKNCGYPFHLQISTKEFLNELVRRFPERPPPRPSRVQMKILEAIEEWRQTICQTSRHREDLGFIRDMHRLLSYKGYTFPQIRRDNAAVLNPSDNLKSAEEMEAEEREAQSAKLQELIRRGTPADLQEANQLMKVMAGYDQSSKTDYRAKAAEEIGKLKRKAQLLDEMLQKVRPGEKIGNSDTFEELATALRTAQPKIQKMVEEESDDTEAVVKLLELNDVINNVTDKYNLVRKGDIEGAKKLPPVEFSSDGKAAAASSSSAPAVEDSLIDLGGDPEPTPASSSTPGPSGAGVSSIQDDLLGLSIDDPNASISGGGGIALGFGANTNIPGPPLLSTTLQSSTASSSSPSFNHSSRAGPLSAAPPSYFAPPPASRTSSNPTTPQPRDTMAAMFGGIAEHHITPKSTPPPQPPQPAEEEWSFASALPESNTLQQNELIICDSNIRIVVDASRPALNPEGPILLRAKFSNNGGVHVQDLTFQMAVTKAYQLKMEPQTGRALLPHQKDGITQMIRVAGAPRGGGNMVKMRWKVSYRLGTGPLNEEQGIIEGLPVQ